MSEINLKLRPDASLRDAAPELLDACKEARTFLIHIEDRVGEAAYSHMYDTLTAAISKAQGCADAMLAARADEYCDNCNAETSLTDHTCIGDRL